MNLHPGEPRRSINALTLDHGSQDVFSIGIMEKKMETATAFRVQGWGCIVIMEKKMETTIGFSV